MYGHGMSWNVWNVIECHKWLFMVLWGNIWNFETTGNMGSIENLGDKWKKKDDMEYSENRGNSKYKGNFGNNNKIWCKGNRGGKRIHGK